MSLIAERIYLLLSIARKGFINIGINGAGRIGRLVLRASLLNPETRVRTNRTNLFLRITLMELFRLPVG